MTLFLTAVALVAFAANSLLCRAALGGELVDPVSFTALRVVSGGAVLVAIAGWHRSGRPSARTEGSWPSALALFVYAIAFSLAYVSLPAGTGALILFGCVQVTMIGAGVWTGERPGAGGWLGLGLASGGLVYLVLPGLAAPDLAGALLMAAAGVAWAVYSLRGRAVRAPIAVTAGNFVRASALATAAGLVAVAGPVAMRLQPSGAGLALVSGIVTSGLGYVAWYRALGGLTATRAAIVQLLVPVIAALGGVALLGEVVSLRLGLASLLVLGGVALATTTGRTAKGVARRQVGASGRG